MDQYPKTRSLPDGGEVELRAMSAADRDALLAFARALTPEDLMFLRVDITQDKVVDDWIAAIGSGQYHSIAAYDAQGMIGYATVSRNPVSWTRHVGEVRVNVSATYRSRGLGRILTAEIFDVAGRIGLKKLTANMTSDQPGAQAAFRRLGFVPEALLADFVQDRNGVTRDMVIMSFDIEGHTDQVGATVQL
jgi:L-amino acid N-acyltransferase YncA